LETGAGGAVHDHDVAADHGILPARLEAAVGRRSVGEERIEAISSRARSAAVDELRDHREPERGASDGDVCGVPIDDKAHHGPFDQEPCRAS